MDAYLDIKLLPDPEFPATVLLNALYAKLHRALAKSKRRDIAVSFPGYRENPKPNPTSKASTKPTANLGTRLRLHGTSTALRELMALEWLQGMHDHLTLSDIAPIPAQVQHIAIRRKQAESDGERVRRRLIRRYAQRHNVSEAEAATHVPVAKPAEFLNLPFLMLKSQSTGQQFRLFINITPAQAEASTGDFNAYGLSQTATVPWF